MIGISLNRYLRKIRRTLACFLAVGCSSLHAQWQVQVTHTDSDLRGLCALNANVAWASGTKGTFLRTIDGGETWHVGQVRGGEELDFRDVEALDGQTAWLLSSGVGSQSRIYKTTDAGKRWNLQFENQEPKAFFDALAFWDGRNGVALSDPVEGRFFLLKTTDGGSAWLKLNASIPAALPNESAFAASGTCLVVQGQSNVWFATGGTARLESFTPRIAETRGSPPILTYAPAQSLPESFRSPSEMSAMA